MSAIQGGELARETAVTDRRYSGTAGFGLFERVARKEGTANIVH